MSHNPTDILDIILQRLKNLATTETVIGQPVEIGDLTLVPVIKLSVGFAAGGGEGKGEKDKITAGNGMIGGGGGGASISPVGFIAFDGETIKFIGVGKGKIETLVETVPELLKKVGLDLSKMTSKGKDKKKDSKDKKDPESEEDSVE